MYTISKHLAYNLWANKKLAYTLLEIDPAVMDMEMKSSFPSITKTVMHIWDAEVIWTQRLQGISLLKWPSQDFKGDRQLLLDSWVKSAENLHSMIETQSPEYLNNIISYSNMKGDKFNNTVAKIMMHVINHGTFHRGQIVTMLRNAGVTSLESTDLITYLRID